MGVLLVILVVNYFKYLIKSNGYIISPCLLVRSLAGFTYISFFLLWDLEYQSLKNTQTENP